MQQQAAVIDVAPEVFELRDYQIDLCARIEEAFASGARSVILQLGTGGGKTVTAASWLKDQFAEHANLVVGWLVHTRGLRTQAAAAMDLMGVEFIDWSTVAPDRRAWQPGRVHAFGATMRIPRMPPRMRKLLVLDECHRSAAPTVAHHVGHSRWDWVLGLSATPARRGWPDEITASHARFVRQWDRIVCGPPLTELVAAGALADVVLRSPSAAGGDRSVLRDDRMRESGISAESEAEFERTLSLDLAVRYTNTLPTRPTIWFCASVRAARRLTRMLPQAALVYAETSEPHRRRCYAKFNTRELLNLVSVGVLVEGVDLPAASRVVLLRASRSRILLSQAVGRGMRPPGTLEAYDFAGSYAELAAHPLDELPWHETLTGVVPTTTPAAAAAPRMCPTENCETLIGPRSGRLCPTCFAETGRWCVACDQPLFSIEDRAHRRCTRCAESERAMHRRWATANGVEPVMDRDQQDDLLRAAQASGAVGAAATPAALLANMAEISRTAEQLQQDTTKILRTARAAQSQAGQLAAAAISSGSEPADGA